MEPIPHPRRARAKARATPLLAALLSVGALLTACGGDSGVEAEQLSNIYIPPEDTGAASSNRDAGGAGDDADNAIPSDCTPSRAVYDSTAAPLIEEHCGACHGAVPDFGAPQSLTLGYDDLLMGAEGERKVDAMVTRLADKTMPPAGSPIPHVALDTLTGWGSCGAVHPDESANLESSRPVWEPPQDPPADAEILDLRAEAFPVGPNVLDLYQCFTFDLDIDAEKLVRRIEFVVDESRVLHHIALLRDVNRNAPAGAHGCRTMPEGSVFTYAWAPGGQPIEFPDGGGLKVSPGERFVLQVHYNNGAGVPDVADNSGVRLYLGPTSGGPEYGMLVVGPILFDVPRQTTRTVEGTCTIREPLSIIAGSPHMHERGVAFNQTVIQSGVEEELIDVTGFSFELQPFYEIHKDLQPNDRIITRCTYDNPWDRAIRSGLNADDEMCFNFTYVTPPLSDRYCDTNAHLGP